MDASASPHKDKNTVGFFKLFRRSSTNGSKRSSHADLIYGTVRRSKEKVHCPITKQESGLKALVEEQFSQHKDAARYLLSLLDHEWNRHNRSQLLDTLQDTVNKDTSVICFLLRRIHQRPGDASSELNACRDRVVHALHKVLYWSDDIKFKEALPDRKQSQKLITRLNDAFTDYCQLVKARESPLEALTDRKSNISIRSADGGLECASSGDFPTKPLAVDEAAKRHSDELPPLTSIYQSPAVRAHIQELLAMDEQITPPPKPPLPPDTAVLDLSLYKGGLDSDPERVTVNSLCYRPHAASDPTDLLAGDAIGLPRANYAAVEGDTGQCRSLVPSGDPSRLLNQADMEQELAQVTRSIQVGANITGLSSADGTLSEVAGKEIAGDCFKTEVESDTEEMEEIIEHEGKKYRRKIKKRIVRTRQIQREIISSANPPLGSGGSPPSSFGGDFPLVDDPVPAGVLADGDSPCGPPPEKPPLPQLMTEAGGCRSNALLEPSDGNLSPIQGYMFWFGQAPGSVTAGQVDSDVVQDSKQLIDYFRSIWHHSEQDASPYERSKSVSYIQRYGQHTPGGAVVHRTTTVSQTRKIKLKTNSTAEQDTEKESRSPSPVRKSGALDETRLEPGSQDDGGYVTSSEFGSSRSSMHHILEETDARAYLLFGEDDMSVTGGCIDALIVYATTPSHNDFIFHETFLAFYRKFVSPEELVERLIYRYNHFRSAPDLPAEIRRESFYHTVVSFLIHVVSELHLEFAESLLARLREFHERLMKEGEYQLAELLHRKMHAQWDLKLRLERDQAEIFKPLSSEGVTIKRYNLMQFSARVIAEQMTLIDLEYFRPIHIEEMLKFTESDGSSNCPNLMRFITNTNNTNAWVLTQILSKERKNSSERKSYLMRFFEISKVLQTLHNYNAYITVSLALNDHKLKGLRSQISKVHRKQIEELPNLLHQCEREQKMCAPVIPHLGKTLQYLIHTETGNPNELKPRDSCPGPIINMWKYWKIHTILSIFARKKKEENDVCGFDLKRNEEVLSFLNNYREILDSNTLSILADEINGKK